MCVRVCVRVCGPHHLSWSVYRPTAAHKGTSSLRLVPSAPSLGPVPSALLALVPRFPICFSSLEPVKASGSSRSHFTSFKPQKPARHNFTSTHATTLPPRTPQLYLHARHNFTSTHAASRSSVCSAEPPGISAGFGPPGGSGKRLPVGPSPAAVLRTPTLRRRAARTHPRPRAHAPTPALLDACLHSSVRRSRGSLTLLPLLKQHVPGPAAGGANVSAPARRKRAHKVRKITDNGWQLAKVTPAAVTLASFS